MHTHTGLTPRGQNRDPDKPMDEMAGRKGGEFAAQEEMEDYIAPEGQQKEWLDGDNSPDDFDEA